MMLHVNDGIRPYDKSEVGLGPQERTQLDRSQGAAKAQDEHERTEFSAHLMEVAGLSRLQSLVGIPGARRHQAHASLLAEASENLRGLQLFRQPHWHCALHSEGQAGTGVVGRQGFGPMLRQWVSIPSDFAEVGQWSGKFMEETCWSRSFM